MPKYRKTSYAIQPHLFFRVLNSLLFVWLCATCANSAVTLPISAGWGHSLIRKNDGTVWAAGQNYGLAGDGHSTALTTPLPVFTGAKAISAGGEYSLFIKTDGTVWATGKNTSGQLGDGTKVSRFVPVQVLSDVKDVATSGVYYLSSNAFSLFLKNDNTVWATGRNSNGQFGNGTTTSQTAPVKVMSGVTAMAAGYNHSLFLKIDGSVWAAGANYYGQLGDGTTTARTSPVKVMTGVKAIAAGVAHSVFLTNDGKVLASGAYSNDQLGNPAVNVWTLPVIIGTEAKAITAGAVHAMFLKTDGTAWGWGLNSGSQLGGAPTDSYLSPVQVLTGVDSISAGVNHSLFVKTDGTVWAVGTNSIGELGDGTTINRMTPVKVMNLDASLSGNADLVSLKPGIGTLTPAFSNTVGTYSMTVSNTISSLTVVPKAVDGGATVRISAKGSEFTPGTSIPLATGPNVISVEVTAQDGIATRSFSITVKRDEPPVQPLIPQASVSAWGFHSLFLHADGTAWAAGNNTRGQLGDGTTTHQSIPVRVMSGVADIVAAGRVLEDGCSFFLKTDATVWAAGRNLSSQLGDGTTFDRTKPVKVLTEVSSISSRDDYTLFLRKDGTVWNSGSHIFGGWQFFATPRPLVLNGIQLGGVQAISAAFDHRLFLMKDGSAYSSGYNLNGQLGNGTTDSYPDRLILVMNDVQAISAGNRYSLFLKKDGSVWATGDNNSGELGIGTRLGITKPAKVMTDVKSISAGDDHSLFLKNDGTVWATGTNLSGQLGIGGRSGDGAPLERLSPVKVAISGVKSISAGAHHSLFVKTDGTVWAAGLNSFGQFGNGTTVGSYTPVQVMKLTPGVPEITVVKGKLNLISGKSSITWGKVKKGSNNTVTLTIRNAGTAPLNLMTASLHGTKVRHFSITAKPASSLAPGKTTTLRITFRPKSIGSQATTLRITSNDANENPFEIRLSGEGTGISKASVPRPQLAVYGSRVNGVFSPISKRFHIREWISSLQVDGASYRIITVEKSKESETLSPLVEVSSDLINWYSGSKHTAILAENPQVIRIRDRTAIPKSGNRYIRVRWIQKGTASKLTGNI